jgi:hypothetical protein
MHATHSTLSGLQVREGFVPNEHGTWQYGRNGWCDGAKVPRSLLPPLLHSDCSIRLVRPHTVHMSGSALRCCCMLCGKPVCKAD